MIAVTFDTLKFVRTLEAAGVPSTQAEAISTAVKDSHDAAELTTKADLREIRMEIQQMETGLRGEMRELEQRMVIKLGSMQVVVIGVIAGIIKLMLPTG